MGILIQLAIYAALAGGALFAFHEFEQKQYVEPAERRGAANQLAADQKVVADLTAQLTAAKKQGTDALADLDSCKTKTQTQSDQVNRWKAEADRRAAETAKAKAAGAVASRAAQTAIASYQEIAARPPVKDQTCEQKLQATDKLLRDAARARVKAAPK